MTREKKRAPSIKTAAKEAEKEQVPHENNMHGALTISEGGAESPAPHTVVFIEELAFKPRHVRIKTGTAVKFFNLGDENHQMYCATLGIHGPEFPPLDSHLITFQEVGRFDVYCSIYSWVNCVTVEVCDTLNVEQETLSRKAYFEAETKIADKLKAATSRQPFEPLSLAGEALEPLEPLSPLEGASKGAKLKASIKRLKSKKQTNAGASSASSAKVKPPAPLNLAAQGMEDDRISPRDDLPLTGERLKDNMRFEADLCSPLMQLQSQAQGLRSPDSPADDISDHEEHEAIESDRSRLKKQSSLKAIKQSSLSSKRSGDGSAKTVSNSSSPPTAAGTTTPFAGKTSKPKPQRLVTSLPVPNPRRTRTKTCTTAHVKICNYNFVPGHLVVEVGTIIVWKVDNSATGAVEHLIRSSATPFNSTPRSTPSHVATPGSYLGVESPVPTIIQDKKSIIFIQQRNFILILIFIFLI